MFVAADGLLLAAWGWWAVSGRFVARRDVVQEEAGGLGMEEGGKAALGDAAAPASTVASPEASAQRAVTEDTLPEPLPGQARPDANGRCPRERQVAINGGCWVKLSDREPCEEFLYVFQGKCYAPGRSRGRRPTSSPESPR
jgi:hypothetical protein